MLIEPTSIPEVLKITPKRHGDARGVFSEIFRRDLFQAAAGPVEFVQDNASVSTAAGTIRGLHFQTDPSAQGKLVRCLRGAILDVAVDIRSGSPTFGQHVAVELTPENGAWLWVPVGFAHGFCTLRPDSEVLYKVTAYYDRACDKGLLWNDPDLAIAWGVSPGDAVLSDKDLVQPRLKDLPAYFHHAATVPASPPQ